MSADEVAAMYSKTIKMATEGKINAKNAWNLPLIDHMRDVVKGEDSTDKKRPQKSCELPEGVLYHRGRHEDLLFPRRRHADDLI